MNNNHSDTNASINSNPQVHRQNETSRQTHPHRLICHHFMCSDCPNTGVRTNHPINQHNFLHLWNPSSGPLWRHSSLTHGDCRRVYIPSCRRNNIGSINFISLHHQLLFLSGLHVPSSKSIMDELVAGWIFDILYSSDCMLSRN